MNARRDSPPDAISRRERLVTRREPILAAATGRSLSAVKLADTPQILALHALDHPRYPSRWHDALDSESSSKGPARPDPPRRRPPCSGDRSSSSNRPTRRTARQAEVIPCLTVRDATPGLACATSGGSDLSICSHKQAFHRPLSAATSRPPLIILTA